MPKMDKEFADREVIVRDRVFHRKNISPEKFSKEVDLGDDATAWDVADELILRHFPEDEHAAWRELRTDEDNPLTIAEINDIQKWLWEEAAGFPLPSGEDSPDGAGSTDTPSGAKPPQRVVSPKK